MYRGALFVPLEGSSGGAAWLLAELGRHLGCDDGSYDPNDHAAALAPIRTNRLYTRITAAEVRRQLIAEKGYTDAELPTERTILTKLNDLVYHLTKVAKVKPQKNP
jgi:hypothetical protein